MVHIDQMQLLLKCSCVLEHCSSCTPAAAQRTLCFRDAPEACPPSRFLPQITENWQKDHLFARIAAAFFRPSRLRGVNSLAIFFLPHSFASSSEKFEALSTYGIVALFPNSQLWFANSDASLLSAAPFTPPVSTANNRNSWKDFSSHFSSPKAAPYTRTTTTKLLHLGLSRVLHMVAMLFFIPRSRHFLLFIGRSLAVFLPPEKKNIFFLSANIAFASIPAYVRRNRLQTSAQRLLV